MKKNLIKRTLFFVLSVLLCMTMFFSCEDLSSSEREDTGESIEIRMINSFGRGSVNFFDTQSGLRKSFLKENPTADLFLGNINGKDCYDTISPVYVGYIIDNQEKLERFFDDSPIIDFETEMIVVVLYSSKNNTYDTVLKVFQQNNTLKVIIKEVYTGSRYRSEEPTLQKGLIWSQPKAEVDDVRIDFIRTKE